MAEDMGSWQDGWRAWERLTGWFQALPPAGPADSHPAYSTDADRALRALADIGVVRRLLDQAEFEAVRTARQHGKSWAEIAIRLGVTRQSAWERWREVDESERPRQAGDEVRLEIAQQIESAAAALARQSETGAASPDLSERTKRRRRRSSVVVPNVVGMSWDDARRALHAVELVGIGPDPDGPPLAALGWPDGVVTDQSPESGAKVPPGSPVTLWLDRGGGSGVREPRRPKPDPKTGRKMRDEAADESVG